MRLAKFKGEWELRDISEADAALVSLSPRNGGITSMVGGFSFELGKLNLVTEANKLQPGSSFKPFIFAAALSQPNWTLASLVNDAPFVTQDGGETTLWRPQNSSKAFYGPTRLRTGLIKSRNLVAIRLLNEITIPVTIEYLKNFGFNTETFPRGRSLALGTPPLSPLQLARAYAVFANGGYLIEPYLIERIEGPDGKIEYVHHPKEPPCETCTDSRNTSFNSFTEENYAKKAIDTDVAYLITNAARPKRPLQSPEGAVGVHIARRIRVSQHVVS